MAQLSPSGPTIRPRRLRTNTAIRRLTAETHLQASDLILPVFVREGLTVPKAIKSLPGVNQETIDTIRKVATRAADLGLGGIMPFAIPELRDATGTAATDPNGILNRTTTVIKQEVGDSLVVIPDLCLDEFTSHGHCGVLDEAGNVDNDATLERYGQMALALSAAGADFLGASGMMDGQIGYVRSILDEAGRTQTGLLAYAAKYASAYYGPFREAVESQLDGDRRTYQQDPANRTEALREIDLDVAEGADIIMVKPGLPYLDIVAAARERVNVPVAVYQVSGEYAQIAAAAQLGWIDGPAVYAESLLCMKRAGASMIASYASLDVAAALEK